MKTKLTESKFKCAPGAAKQLFSRIACLAAAILICSSARAQNLYVSGSDAGSSEIFKFTWDGQQSIFASGFINPWDLAFANAGNLFVVDYDRSALLGDAAIYKITPNGVRTRFASGLSYPAYVAVASTGNVFVADYDHGIIYQYKPTGSRATFASGLHHPVGMAFNSAGNLFVVDNTIGNIASGRIYEYKPNGSRATFAVLNSSDRPADLAFDSMGNLLVVDAGGVSSAGGVIPNAIYKFTLQGVRSTFASGQALSESFACLAFQPIPCCE